MFIDEASIVVKGGDGGDGIISFDNRRGNRHGGPDGGSGGKGGDVYIKANRSKNTLVQFNNKNIFDAPQGEDGGTDNKRGKSGEDIEIEVPIGTVVREAHSGKKIDDLDKEGKKILVARGGKGGRGNRHFSNSSRRAPRIREFGGEGERKKLDLELKMLADVGIIGLPNAGKSLLLSKISAQHPEVENYQFTTLDPLPGVVEINDWETFTAVEIPGLIKGAYKGKGLGNKFLKHLDRTSLLVHLVDFSENSVGGTIENYKIVRNELRQFSSQVDKKDEIVAGNKLDLISKDRTKKIEDEFKKMGLQVNHISAKTGRGIEKLKNVIYDKLQEMAGKKEEESEEEEKHRFYEFSGEEGYQVKRQGDALYVRGKDLEQLANNLDFSTEDAVDYFYEQLHKRGVIKELEKKGAEDGSTIVIGGRQFEYVS